MTALNNPWLIGIGGGIISGFVVAFVTRWIFQRRERKEYRQRVDTANNDVFFSVRSVVSDLQLPSKEVLDSLLESTARKYRVKVDDLYDASSLANDLVKEILGNLFLDSKIKIEFSDKIEAWKDQLIQAGMIKYFLPTSESDVSANYMSIVTGIMTAFMGIAGTLLYVAKEKFVAFGSSKLVIVVLVLMSTALLSIVFSATILHDRDRTKKKNEDELDFMKGPRKKSKNTL